MLLWHPTNLPDRFFDAFGQRLERFTKADAGHFHVGVGQHEMVDQMSKGCSRDRHPEIFHMRKIGLGTLSWSVNLLKDHLLRFAMKGLPASDMALQCAHLCRAIPLWMALAQQSKQGRAL